MEVIAVIGKMLQEAMQIERDKIEAIFNFIQTHEPSPTHTLVRVGKHDVVHPGQVTHIKCKVPANFAAPVALFKVKHPYLRLEQLHLGDVLVEVYQTN